MSSLSLRISHGVALPPRGGFATCAAACCLAAGMLAAGCNVDGQWREPGPPKGAVVDTTVWDDDGSRDAVAVPAAVDTQEVDLIETVVAHRMAYRRALEELRDHYESHGNAMKLAWAEFELKGLRRVKPFRYFVDAEIPPESLRPTERAPEADALYQRGRVLMREGGYRGPGLYLESMMIEASCTFRELIEKYPSSDKIDDAAFFLGEIDKEYMPGQEMLAVKWYERAWTWDPKTPHPARFKAAVVYDHRLHDRDRALELYHAVIRDETDSARNVRIATNRIHALTKDHRTASADGS